MTLTIQFVIYIMLLYGGFRWQVLIFTNDRDKINAVKANNQKWEYKVPLRIKAAFFVCIFTIVGFFCFQLLALLAGDIAYENILGNLIGMLMLCGIFIIKSYLCAVFTCLTLALVTYHYFNHNVSDFKSLIHSAIEIFVANTPQGFEYHFLIVSGVVILCGAIHDSFKENLIDVDVTPFSDAFNYFKNLFV